MAARPEGTDGSDHVFREQVERAYKKLPGMRVWSSLSQYVVILPHLVRFIWFAGIGHLVGLTLNYQAFGIFALGGLAFICWTHARVGHANESLFFVKLAGSFNVISLGLLAVTGYQYYNRQPVELHVNSLFASYLEANHGLSGDVAWSYMKDMDKIVDVALFCFLCIVIGNQHPYIVANIELDKRTNGMGMKVLSNSSNKKSDTPSAKPALEDSKPSGGARRRPARA
uniref:Uncharacterized protein n=1 Tax=Chlamydomonas euryale TaxID=1486919 RepID=A0A7R9V6K5_9CHLO|mmetsp:Transcript_22888/g.68032  ORF Transcript_22888/g.68032 Transcript_22888/m.68032 type:complete len:227 (+) Transcript_22888:39-719(+)